MESLDKIDYKKLDPKRMISHIEVFPRLCEDALSIAEKFIVPSYYVKAKKIVMVGMGGSGQAGDIIRDLFKEESGYVIDSVHNYKLPGYVIKIQL
jgi:glucose-6-phosphate isomerase